MPVGRRTRVCTSACLSRARRTVAPAPPANRTLSGNTTAARPCCLRMVKMCWRKLSCLLLVLAQKSSRLMMSDSLEVSPAFVDDGDTALLAEGWIGQDDVV